MFIPYNSQALNMRDYANYINIQFKSLEVKCIRFTNYIQLNIS